MIKLQGQKVRIIDYDEMLPVTRDGEVNVIEGKPVVLSQTNFTIRANVQPVEGRDLLLVPEFDRFKEQYFVFTETKLIVNDKITRLGVNFVVQNAQPWGSFWECRMMRIDVGPRATP